MGGTSVGYDYLRSATYAPNGAHASMVLGNGFTETSTYNKRFQPLNQQVASSIITPLYRSYGFYDSASHNNGNVASIADNLAPGRTQNFTYDNLNRILTAKTFSTSGADCWAQQFGYDAWGNLLTALPTQSGCSMTQLNVGVNTRNQIINSGFSYDLAGNLLADGTNSYIFDAENRISSVNSGAVTYVYDADSNRVRKSIGSAWTDYVYFGESVVAEKKPNGIWSDYVYTNGRILVRADIYDARIHLSGTNCARATCGDRSSGAYLPNVNGIVVRTGDSIWFRQYQTTAQGGMMIGFSDGTITNWVLNDSDGQQLNNDTIKNTWHLRHADLSAYAGKTLSYIILLNEVGGADGHWDMWFSDIAIVNTDGKVASLYARQEQMILTPASLGCATSFCFHETSTKPGPSSRIAPK